MPNSAVVDNDVLIKCTCYSVLDHLPAALGDPSPLGVLGAARFVVRSAVRRTPLTDADVAVAFFDSFLSGVVELEPTPSEIALATEIEEAALRAALPLDAGESQLCAIALARAIDIMVTGDKRAASALELLLQPLPALAGLLGRLLSLEQLLLTLLATGHYGCVAAGVSAAPTADKAITICFRGDEQQAISGLTSYLNHLRVAAPSMVYGDDTYT